jgi:uncharacterized cupin superfamily protein
MLHFSDSRTRVVIRVPGCERARSRARWIAGVWEMTPGVMSDVESDEVFVVLSGSATVEFDDEGETLHIEAGDVVRLAAGARTVWSVTETLRKVYLA